MKLLSQSMDMPLNVMMVLPQTGIPTSWINTRCWADKYSFHVNGPILHQELAKCLDKHITRQDSCDGEEHFFFYRSKKSLQASKDLE